MVSGVGRTISVTTLAIASIAAAGIAENADAAPSTTDAAAVWAEAAASDGFEISQGTAEIQDSATCDAMVKVFDTCWGNNPAAPYVLLKPPVDGTYVDPVYGAPFTETLDSGVSVNYFYRLAAKDALVTVIDMPPKAAYLGFNTYMFTRPLKKYDFEATPTNLSPNDQRVEVFGSVNDAVNQEVIKSETGLGFGANKPVVIITSANQTLVKAIRDNMANYGLDEKYSVIEKLRDNINPGTGENSDDFFTLMRYAMPVDEDAADAWREDVADHVKVYRVSNESLPVDRYGDLHLTTKQDGYERYLQDSVDELSKIMSRWLKKYQDEEVSSVAMISSETVDAEGNPSGLVGVECIAEGSNCLGDSQDTESYRFQTIGVLEAGKTAVVVGVNHTLLDNARYTSVGVYNSESLTGLVSASQSDDSGTLNGSAERVLDDLGLTAKASPELLMNLPNLYVVLISRACPIDSKDCLAIDAGEVPTDVSVMLTQRAYLKPGTKTGANPDTMVSPVTISAVNGLGIVDLR